MEQLLLASNGWILDLAFFLILLFGVALGIRKGFISGICRLAGWLFAVAFAIFFCVLFADFLENAFGMTTAISNGLVKQFTKNEALNFDISGANLEETLAEANVWKIVASAIVKGTAGTDIPQGTTLAMLISSVVANWISIAISFVLLILLVRIGAVILDKIFSGLVDSVKPLRIVNHFLGGLLGVLKGGILIFLVLAIFHWISAEAIDGYILSSNVVGKIYASDWFHNATDFVGSFAWLNPTEQSYFNVIGNTI